MEPQQEEHQAFTNVVGGRHIFLTNDQNNIVLKPFRESEYNFYLKAAKFPPGSNELALKQWMPTFYQGHFQNKSKAKVCVEGDKQEQMENPLKWSKKKLKDNTHYMKLGNIVYGMKYPCILDVKIGIQQKNEDGTVRKQHSLSPTHKFKMCGYQVYQPKTQKKIFKYKYYCYTLTLDNIEENLAYFFFDGQSIRKQIIANVVKKLDELVQCLYNIKGYSFAGISCLICYDGAEENLDKASVKIIDFAKSKEVQNFQNDHDRITGLENLRNFLNNVKNNPEKYVSLIKLNPNLTP